MSAPRMLFVASANASRRTHNPYEIMRVSIEIGNATYTSGVRPEAGGIFHYLDDRGK